MAVRNQHVRQSKNYIIECIGGVRYYIKAEAFVSKNIIYDAKKKIASGKIDIPISLKESGKTILVVCKGNNEYSFDIV